MGLILNLSKATIRNYGVTPTTGSGGLGASPYGIYWCYYLIGDPDVIYIQFGTTEYPTGSAVQIDNTSVPTGSDFSLSGIASNPNITLVEIAPQEGYSELQISLDNTITGSDSGLISYTKGSNPLKDLDGKELNEWTDEPITESN